MNRIEQVAALTPAQQQRPRLPRALAGARRRAALVLLQPREATGRTRRGTTGLAVAIAALAVPVLPGAAFGATAPAGPGTGAGASVGASAVKANAPHTRHHLHHRFHHGEVLPEPGTVTVQKWEASGWTFTVSDRPADMGLLGHVMHRHGHYAPWLAEPARAIHGPRTDDPGALEWQTPADTTDSTESDEVAGRAEHFPDGTASVRAARSRDVPTPLIPATRPANTKQMLVPGRQGTDLPESGRNLPSEPQQVLAAAGPSGAPCLRAPSTPDTDRAMLAHLRPTTDAMNVVVTHPRTACGARVDYLSQARA